MKVKAAFKFLFVRIRFLENDVIEKYDKFETGRDGNRLIDSWNACVPKKDDFCTKSRRTAKKTKRMCSRYAPLFPFAGKVHGLACVSSLSAIGIILTASLLIARTPICVYGKGPCNILAPV
jgi:hypothetical protein